MRSTSQTSTPIPAITAPAPPSACPAGVARVGVTRLRLALLVRLPPLGDEVALLDLVVDEIPRQQLVEAVSAMDEAIGVDEVVPPAAQRAQQRPPTLRIRVQALQQLGHAPVAARQQRLQVALARALGLDLHGGNGAQLAADPCQLALERPEVLHRLPLER